jgi:hypothetical protein
MLFLTFVRLDSTDLLSYLSTNYDIKDKSGKIFPCETIYIRNYSTTDSASILQVPK